MLVSPAYAKLNLTLEVLRRRDDGLHDIESLLLTIDWHDLAGVELCDADAPSCRLRVTGPEAGGVPVDGSNLATRAAVALSALAGRPLEVAVWLHKRLPSQAGLGGGSSDAATVLRSGLLLLAGTGTEVAPERTQVAAQQLGADVPALLHGGLQLMSGTGERLVPHRHVDLHCAVALAGASSTATAYANLVEAEHSTQARAGAVLRSLKAGKAPADAELGSALESPAVRGSPQLAAGLERLRGSTPGHPWHLTGSGGCAFAIARSSGEADRLVAAALAAGLAARACRSVRPL
jgi:4-diphosphocytidyl-2-C-methyl-D-erythritol kinase